MYMLCVPFNNCTNRVAPIQGRSNDCANECKVLWVGDISSTTCVTVVPCGIHDVLRDSLFDDGQEETEATRGRK